MRPKVGITSSGLPPGEFAGHVYELARIAAAPGNAQGRSTTIRSAVKTAYAGVTFLKNL
jgi:hypothetical protein